MIRPFTCLCVLLAAGSGLYLYQTKHRTLMLDQQIADVLKRADEARAQTVELRATYALLNQPERLTELAGRFLSLKPMAVTQYVQLASLDQHLPPVQQFPRPDEAPVPAAAATPENTTDDAAEGDAEPQLPAQQDIPMAAAVPAAPPTTVARHEPEPHTEPAAPRAYAGDPPPRAANPVRQARLTEADTARSATRVSESSTPAPRSARHDADPDEAFAGGYRAQPMPMAAPRPVTSAVLATASLHPAGTPSRPRITNAEAYMPAYRPASRPQPSYSGYGYGGSMLGGSSSVAMAPPIPIAN